MYFADFMERYRDSCINNIYYYTSKRIHEIFCFQEEQHKFKTKANIKIPQHAKELLRLYRFVNFPEEKKNTIKKVQNNFQRPSLSLKHNGHEKFTIAIDNATIVFCSALAWKTPTRKTPPRGHA